MTKYLKVDREECYGISVCDTKDEVKSKVVKLFNEYYGMDEE